MALDASSRQKLPAYIPANCRVSIDAPVVLGDGSSLEGEGSSSILTADFSGKAANCLIRNDWRKGNPGIRLANFAIDRAGPGIQHGILLNGVDGLVVDRLKVYGATKGIAGVLAISSIMNATGNAPRLLSRNVTVSGCQIDDCGNFGVQVGKVELVSISGNTFSRAFREAIGVEPEMCDTASQVSILQNKIQGSPNLSQGTQTGLIIATLTSGGAGITDLLIAKNTVVFSGARQGTFSPGIAIYGAMNAIIRENRISNSPGPGIQLGNAFRSTAWCGGVPRSFSGRTSGVTVTRNRITSSNAGRNFGAKAMAIFQAVEENHISDNMID